MELKSRLCPSYPILRDGILPIILLIIHDNHGWKVAKVIGQVNTYPDHGLYRNHNRVCAEKRLQEYLLFRKKQPRKIF